MKHEKSSFQGKIKIISSSPHGDPEGVVLTDGSFVKIPPHSLLKAEKIQVGAMISGDGELIAKEPNKVYHHAKIKIGAVTVADDHGKPHERDELKEQHKKDIDKKKRTQAPHERMTVRGKIEALGLKPKGEVDRIIFSDGTSVHLPKELSLDSEQLTLGDTLKIEGQGQAFDGMTFLKAKSISTSKGDVLATM